MTIHLHTHDLPDSVTFTGSVAVDCETMGLNLSRDRLCLIQLSQGDGVVHVVQFTDGYKQAKNLRKLFKDKQLLKIFHFARFDVAAIYQYLGVACAPVFCTKIASKLTRTYTDKHGLKELCKVFLDVDLSKQQQTSDWGATTITPEQLQYAASDVLYLHRLHSIMQTLLERENRLDIARACFAFLPTRARLDLLGWEEPDIFSHS